MKGLDNTKVRNKLLMSLAVTMLFMVLVTVIGWRGIKKGSDSTSALLEEQETGVIAGQDYLNKVESARAALVTMLSAANAAKIAALNELDVKTMDLSTLKAAINGVKPDPAKLNPLKEKIDASTKEANKILEYALNADHDDEAMPRKLKEIKDAWEAFVNTRENELIPLIYAGRIEEANKLALGIQAERYKKFTTGANEFIEIERKGAEDFTKELKDDSRYAMILMVVVGITATVIGSILSLIISGNIVNRLSPITVAAVDMADGNLGRTVSVTGNDEIGVLSSSFNKMSMNLKELIGTITQASSQIGSASEELSATAEQISKGMQTQTGQTSQIASAMEEMSATVLEVAKNSQTAASSAGEASLTAKKGGEVVARTVEGMKKIAATVQESARTIGELGKSSDQIGEIIAVIDDIADQTNLLALNAAIEAARAGEQGRGFAVVADEVRKLAERTTKATKEIAQMINNIQKETVGAVSAMEAGTKEVSEGVELSRQAGESLNMIVDAVQKVNDMIRQIATASEQQSAAAEQISKSIEEIASVTKDTASGSHQTSTASQELSRMATELQGMVGQFKI
jgi:methyl-accepting chemotaxis protein